MWVHLSCGRVLKHKHRWEGVAMMPLAYRVLKKVTVALHDRLLAGSEDGISTDDIASGSLWECSQLACSGYRASFKVAMDS